MNATMKITKLIVFTFAMLLLTSCGSNNNDEIKLDDRPLYEVTESEGTAYIDDEILSVDNLYEYIQKDLYKNFEQLSQLNKDDFMIGDITLSDSTKNKFDVSYYHKFSDYEVKVFFYLDYTDEDGKVFLYNLGVHETTYDYNQDMFKDMHAETIVNYLSNSNTDYAEACQNFDISNEKCLAFTSTIDLLDMSFSLDNMRHNDNHFTGTVVVDDNEEIFQVSTEVQIGINDEGSFIYDLSFLQLRETDFNLVNEENHASNLRSIFMLMKTGTKDISEIRDEYFYGNPGTLLALDNFTFTDTTIVYAVNDSPNTVTVQISDPSGQPGVDAINMTFDVYKTQNGNTFYIEHYVSESDYVAHLQRKSAQYERLGNSIFSQIEDDSFCLKYQSFVPDCETLSENVTSGAYILELTSFSFGGNASSLLYNLKIIDSETRNYYLNTYFIESQSLFGFYGAAIKPKTVTELFHLHPDTKISIYNQYIQDLFDDTISNEAFLSKYQTVYDPAIPKMRENLQILYTYESFTENWAYEQSEFNETILKINRDFGSSLTLPEIIVFLEISIDDSGKYIINDYSGLIGEFMSPDYIHAIKTAIETDFLDTTISDEAFCTKTYNKVLVNPTAECLDFRSSFDSNTMSFIVSQEFDETYLKFNLAIYENETNELINVIHIQARLGAQFTQYDLLEIKFPNYDQYYHQSSLNWSINKIGDRIMNYDTESTCGLFSNEEECYTILNGVTKITTLDSVNYAEFIYDKNQYIRTFQVEYEDGETNNIYIIQQIYVKHGRLDTYLEIHVIEEE